LSHELRARVGVVFLVMFSCVAFRYGESALDARKINAANRNEAHKIFAALEQYRGLHGRYPTNLSERLLASRPRLSDETHLLYTAAADSQRYWVGVFPHRVATLVLPADEHLVEYDSLT